MGAVTAGNQGDQSTERVTAYMERTRYEGLGTGPQRVEGDDDALTALETQQTIHGGRGGFKQKQQKTNGTNIRQQKSQRPAEILQMRGARGIDGQEKLNHLARALETQQRRGHEAADKVCGHLQPQKPQDCRQTDFLVVPRLGPGFLCREAPPSPPRAPQGLPQPPARFPAAALSPLQISALCPVLRDGCTHIRPLHLVAQQPLVDLLTSGDNMACCLVSSLRESGFAFLCPISIQLWLGRKVVLPKKQTALLTVGCQGPSRQLPPKLRSSLPLPDLRPRLSLVFACKTSLFPRAPQGSSLLPPESSYAYSWEGDVPMGPWGWPRLRQSSAAIPPRRCTVEPGA